MQHPNNVNDALDPNNATDSNHTLDPEDTSDGNWKDLTSNRRPM